MTAYVSAAAGDWGVTTNWTPNGVPGSGDTVSISHAITNNASRTIGTGSGTAITINAAGSLEHVAPGTPAALTFTINGNVMLMSGSTWSAGSSGTPYGTSTDELAILFGGAFYCLNLGGTMSFWGNPALNEAADLDRTTTASGITSGTSTAVLTDDLGLRAGGGDVLIFATDDNGWLNGDLVTTTGYVSGTNTATISGTFSANHQSGTRVMNMTRNVRFESSTTTRRGSLWWNYASTGPICYFDHCGFRYMGNAATTTGALYSSGLAMKGIFTDCAFFQNRYQARLTIGNKAENPEDEFYYDGCNFGFQDTSLQYTEEFHPTKYLDCWFICEWVIDSAGWTCSRSIFEDCEFDSIYRLFSTTASGRHDLVLTNCKMARFDTAWDVIYSNTNGFGLTAVFDYCKMDASLDDIIYDATDMTDEGRVLIIDHNQTVGDHLMVKRAGTIEDEGSVIFAGDSKALKFSGTSNTIPLTHKIYQPVLAGRQIKVHVYARKDSSYGSSNRPQLTVRGCGTTETTDVMSDTDDTYEQLECQVTPSRSGFLECVMQTMSNTGAAYFDVFSVEIA